MSSENLLTKFDQLSQQFHEIVLEEKAKLHAEVNDDIIHLNIGGQKITTKRSTLCLVENSRLADMFSGRGEDNLDILRHFIKPKVTPVAFKTSKYD